MPSKHEKQNSINHKKEGLRYLIIKYKYLHMVKPCQPKLRTDDETGKTGVKHTEK